MLGSNFNIKSGRDKCANFCIRSNDKSKQEFLALYLHLYYRITFTGK